MQALTYVCFCTLRPEILLESNKPLSLSFQNHEKFSIIMSLRINYFFFNLLALCPSLSFENRCSMFSMMMMMTCLFESSKCI